MTLSPAARIRAAGSALVILCKEYAKTIGLDYLPPLGPSKRLDTPERGSGGVSRPTEDTATDERRLRLRAAVLETEVALEDISETATNAARSLTDARDAWAGIRA
ncbi:MULTISPECIES: DUF7169 domain-containing protein [Bacteria]|uniref:DUF7169 domain-containing protein n=1 Tax=Bacteria TaxID=2 RepID=UPI003C7C68B5